MCVVELCIAADPVGGGGGVVGGGASVVPSGEVYSKVWKGPKRSQELLKP